jgi:hypothetical protein
VDLQEVRDLIIIIAGSIGILLLFVLLVAAVVLTVAARVLIGTANGLLKSEVAPLLQSARQTVDNVRGTATYVTETAISPIIRLYSMFAGIRRFLGVLASFGRKRR